MNSLNFKIGDDTPYGRLACVEFWNVKFEYPEIANTKHETKELYEKYQALEDDGLVGSHFRYGFLCKDNKIRFKFIHEIESNRKD